MYLEVVSPEAVLFASEVDSVSVPGTDGEFQILINHAPIISTLRKGIVKIFLCSQDSLLLKDNLHKRIVPHADDDYVLTVDVQSGTIEFKENRAMILLD